MWAEGRWCSAAWGRRSEQSCWTVCSCSPLQTEAPGRPEPAAWRRAGVRGRQLEERGRRGVGAGKNPSSAPCRWTLQLRIQILFLICSSSFTKKTELKVHFIASDLSNASQVLPSPPAEDDCELEALGKARKWAMRRKNGSVHPNYKIGKIVHCWVSNHPPTESVSIWRRGNAPLTTISVS